MLKVFALKKILFFSDLFIYFWCNHCVQNVSLTLIMLIKSV